MKELDGVDLDNNGIDDGMCLCVCVFVCLCLFVSFSFSFLCF